MPNHVEPLTGNPSSSPDLLPADDSYFTLSRAPFASLVFALPWLAVYELGLMLMGPDAILNGADAWLDRLTRVIGLGHSWAVPLIVVVVLLVWQHYSQRPWRVSSRLLVGMLIECILLGFVLLLVAQLQGKLFGRLAAMVDLVTLDVHGTGIGGWLRRLVSYCGAGVYEETLFRLLLLPALAVAIHACGITWSRAWLAAAIVSSLLFSSAHYVGQLGDPINPLSLDFWYGFTFRFLAGLFFSLLFVYRGFGIAVGTHALYDIFVGLF
jgi:membrane protease YdiL (CAAX protease family)